MSVLLPTDDLELRAALDEDAHGWAESPGTEADPLWAGRGALQLSAGLVGTDAAGAGGSGPFAPRSTSLGSVYLPPDSGATDGMVLSARGKAYALSGCRVVVDPVGGGLDCLVANLSGLADWPTS